MRYTKQRFDEVLHELEQERRRVDEDSKMAYIRGRVPAGLVARETPPCAATALHSPVLFPLTHQGSARFSSP